jgi:hypothetical protein
MLNIKNKLSIAGLLCGLFIVYNLSASAQFIPPGSYQKSCRQMKVVGADLEAGCDDKKKQGVLTIKYGRLADFFECDGDIWNDDSTLKCNRNVNSGLMQNAKNNINIALGNVLGMTDDNYEMQKKILRSMFADGLARKFYEGKLGGFLSSGTILYVTDWISRPENSYYKTLAINTAFLDVYNYGPSPKDMAFYNAQKTVYQSIVQNESKKLNSDKVIRRMMIFAAYKKSMGRVPTKAEIDYWMPKNEYFKQLVDVSRAYLYAPNGANDLAETVKRALKDKSGNDPSITEMNQAIIKYAKTKSLYSEM